MKHSLKGALLSGIVFPGLGHLALKHYSRGIIVILTSTIGMVVIVAEAVRIALSILEKIELEGGQISMEAITAAAHQASGFSGNLIMNAGLIILCFSWLFGVIDAYRVGKKVDDHAEQQEELDAKGR